MDNRNWPAWYNGPNGETKIFHSADEVPAGWTTGSEKRSVGAASAPSPAPSPAPAPGAKPADVGAEIDAHGHPWSAGTYAATKSKTTAGLWRLAVGKARPAPAPGYPLDL